MNGKKMIHLVLAIFAIGFVLVVAGYYSGKALVTLEERAGASVDGSRSAEHAPER